MTLTTELIQIEFLEMSINLHVGPCPASQPVNHLPQRSPKLNIHSPPLQSANTRASYSPERCGDGRAHRANHRSKQESGSERTQTHAGSILRSPLRRHPPNGPSVGPQVVPTWIEHQATQHERLNAPIAPSRTRSTGFRNMMLSIRAQLTQFTFLN